ncbi:hypothetical protein K445DRAFT_199043 [Daldinia sp. EC12]|nr:hypothetical protein K445DRAFT_199043 [Daldinia sp. EC12]
MRLDRLMPQKYQGKSNGFGAFRRTHAVILWSKQVFREVLDLGSLRYPNLMCSICFLEGFSDQMPCPRYYYQPAVNGPNLDCQILIRFLLGLVSLFQHLRYLAYLFAYSSYTSVVLSICSTSRDSISIILPTSLRIERIFTIHTKIDGFVAIWKIK